jgi:ATP-binding cassette subfamily B protein RaxB
MAAGEPPDMASRVPVVLQSEQAECGLAALNMIAVYHGHSLALGEMRTRFAALDRGPTLHTILATADALSLETRPVRAEVGELRQLRLPAILHWQFNHFVVLVAVRRGRYVLHDPAQGRRVLGRNRLDEAFTGVAVEFSRRIDFAPEEGQQRATLRPLLRSFKGLGRYAALMCGLLLAIQLLALAPAIATQLLIDEVVAGQQRRWLYGVLAGTGLILVASIVLDALRKRVALFVSTRLAVDSSAAVIGHMLQLPAQTLQKRSVGDLLARVASLQPLKKALTETALQGLVNVVVVVTTLTAMFLYSPQLALLSVVVLVLTTLLHAALLPSIRARNLEAIVHGAKASNSLIESLRGYDAVVSLGLRAQRLAHWQQSFMHAANAAARRVSLGITAATMQSLLAAVDQLLFLGIGIVAIGEGRLTLGVLFAMFALRARLATAVAALFSLMQELYLLRSHVERISEVVAEQRLPEPAAAAVRRRLRGAIRCEDVHFSYTTERPLIAAFSCDIRPGERVVIAGPSGSGKTTLLRILAGSLSAQRGRLMYDSMESNLWDGDALRRQFGTVLQNDSVFQGSVADNVSCFDPSPDLVRVKKTLQIADIWADICSLPMQLHTPIDGACSTLSGGQLQRLLLARALYRRPAVLFLDEATAHLDEASEMRILDNLSRLPMTIVSVAHGSQALAKGGRRIVLQPSLNSASAV